VRFRVAGLAGILVLLAFTFGTAFGHGHTADQLVAAGWTCFNAGPNNWTHCNPPGTGNSDSVIQVKVFGESGYPFLGTESLIHKDIYERGRQQPCSTDGGGPYHFLGVPPYYACHHFSTH
jgi:hypothetical protein